MTLIVIFSSIVLDVAGAGSIVLPSQADRLEGASVPAGTYTVSARAMNATGSSASSNAVTLTIPGPCSGPPMAPAHFLAYKTGATLYLIWESPQSGPAPTGYVVNVTGSIAGNFPTTTRFVSAAVGPGTYTVSVTATNACGTATTGTQSLTIP